MARIVGGRVEPVISAATVTGLGDGVGLTGMMDEGRVELTAMAIAKMAEEARHAGAKRLCVACSEPVRSVVNADELLDRVTQLAGTLPRILNEFDEMRLSFRGIAASAPEMPDGMIAVEPNLRSTLVLGARDRSPWWSTTIPAGLQHLAEHWGLEDPPHLDDLYEIAHDAERLIIPLAERHPSDFAVASGPLSMAVGRLEDDQIIDGGRAEELLTLTSSLSAIELCERAGITAGRAALLGAAVAVIEGVRRAYRLSSIEIVSAGLREGLLLEAAGSG